MLKILANDGLEKDGIFLLEEAGFTVDTQKIAQDDLPSALQNYEVLIVRSATKVRKELIDACPNLKVIARAGVGLDNIDVEYATSKGIKVLNTPNASSRSVAELTLAHILCIARGLHTSNRIMPLEGNTQFSKHKKLGSQGFEIEGKKLGIIGFGNIGQEVAKLALANGMRILPVDPYVDEATVKFYVFNNENIGLEIKLNTVKMSEMLKEADIITLHIPATKGKYVLGEEEFNAMKNGVVIINTARGGIIDEEALLKALNSGKISAAGLDVFENEPVPRTDLLQHPHVSLSPHIGGSTLQAQTKIGMQMADAIINHYQKKGRV
jgi:D-3-phosphoglycerate dehydrogenase / 2-oxoglutarate reductase